MKSHVIVVVILAVIALIAVNTTAYFYKKYQANQAMLHNSSLAESQTRDLLNKVGKLMDLPQGEQPAIATVGNVSSLKGQAFFAKAHNGDKILIYTKAREAILYSPLTNKIVQVSSVTMGDNQPVTAPSLTGKPVQTTPFQAVPTAIPTK